MNCVAEKGEAIYQSEQADAANLSLHYSPSVVINGVYLENVDRSPEGLKGLICSAFNTSPASCNTTLSGGAATTSGGCG